MPVAKADEFRNRTKAFALQVIRLVESLPETRSTDMVAQHLLRAGPSVGAHYRRACKAVSREDFLAGMALVEQECDQAVYWLELVEIAGWADAARLDSVLKEARTILAMVHASLKASREKGASAAGSGEQPAV